MTLFSCLQDFASRAKLAVQNLVQKVGFFGILACASVSFSQELGDLWPQTASWVSCHGVHFCLQFLWLLWCSGKQNLLELCYDFLRCWCILCLGFWASSDPGVCMDWRVENHLQESWLGSIHCNPPKSALWVIRNQRGQKKEANFSGVLQTAHGFFNQEVKGASPVMLF